MDTNPDRICQRTQSLYDQMQSRQLLISDHLPIRILSLGRPEAPKLVSPRELRRRRLGTIEGRAALIHALAHIEFNAIHLAIDACYRFVGMPEGFYVDWLSVAAEEAKHFQLLRAHLIKLGYDYGDFPAHNGLWQMAIDTDDDVMIRMALVPRLLEARGLDVAPQMAEALKAAGDTEAYDILQIIIKEEIGHVRIGNHWFHWCCQQRALEPLQVFKDSLESRAKNILRGPLAYELRKKAGFTDAELEWLEDSLLKK